MIWGSVTDWGFHLCVKMVNVLIHIMSERFRCLYDLPLLPDMIHPALVIPPS